MRSISSRNLRRIATAVEAAKTPIQNYIPSRWQTAATAEGAVNRNSPSRRSNHDSRRRARRVVIQRNKRRLLHPPRFDDHIHRAVRIRCFIVERRGNQPRVRGPAR